MENWRNSSCSQSAFWKMAMDMEFLVKKEVERHTDRSILLGAIDITLYRLQDKSFLNHSLAAVSKKRRPRKRLFRITKKGMGNFGHRGGKSKNVGMIRNSKPDHEAPKIIRPQLGRNFYSAPDQTRMVEEFLGDLDEMYEDRFAARGKFIAEGCIRSMRSTSSTASHQL